MIRSGSWLLTAMLWLSGPAYGAGTRDALVGTWDLVDAKARMRIEFLHNGRYRAITSRSVLVGNWSLVDQGHIATWSDARRPKRVNGFRLEGDLLIIIDNQGGVHTHRRVE